MDEARYQPPKIFRVCRWVMTIAAPLAILVLVLVLAGVISDDELTVPRVWGDLVLVVIFGALTIHSWVRPDKWLLTTYLAIAGTGLSRLVLAVIGMFVAGPGFATIFWLLGGCAFIVAGWGGVRATRRGENPFESLRRRRREPQ